MSKYGCFISTESHYSNITCKNILGLSNHKRTFSWLVILHFYFILDIWYNKFPQYSSRENPTWNACFLAPERFNFLPVPPRWGIFSWYIYKDLIFPFSLLQNYYIHQSITFPGCASHTAPWVELASKWVSTYPCPFCCSLVTGGPPDARLSPESMNGGVRSLLPWFF